jgi:hypothetical protein
MQVTTVTRNLLSTDDATTACCLAFTEATLQTILHHVDIGCYCHSYTEDVDRTVFFQQKLVNIEERKKIVY